MDIAVRPLLGTDSFRTHQVAVFIPSSNEYLMEDSLTSRAGLYSGVTGLMSPHQQRCNSYYSQMASAAPALCLGFATAFVINPTSSHKAAP